MSSRWLTAACTLCILLQACHTLQEAERVEARLPPPSSASLDTAMSGEQLSAREDHFIAWVPRSMAPTEAVAAALAQVEWGNAREQAGRELCSGNWLFNGAVTERIDPYPVTAPAQLGGYPAWYYRVSHRPGIRGCTNATSRQVYALIRANLPRWTIVRTATPPDSSIDQQAGLLPGN